MLVPDDDDNDPRIEAAIHHRLRKDQHRKVLVAFTLGHNANRELRRDIASCAEIGATMPAVSAKPLISFNFPSRFGCASKSKLDIKASNQYERSVGASFKACAAMISRLVTGGHNFLIKLHFQLLKARVIGKIDERGVQIGARFASRV